MTQYVGPFVSLDIVTDATAARVLVDADAQKYIRMTNAGANTVTVPPNTSVGFPLATQITGVQAGAGQTTFVAGAGVTINTPHTLKTNVRYSSWCLTKVATDTWDLTGDLALT